MALRDEMELWAKQNLRSVEDYYEAMRGIQDAADGQIFDIDAGTPQFYQEYGDYVFRSTAKALDKIAKKQDLKQNPGQAKLKNRLLK